LGITEPISLAGSSEIDITKTQELEKLSKVAQGITSRGEGAESWACKDAV
ncbi:hypothetical protein MKW98_003778, partial [Papaver atlanticum]